MAEQFAPESSQSIAAVLNRISKHLNQVAANARLLDTIVLETSIKTGPKRSEVLQELQQIDYISQCLDDLARLTILLAQMAEYPQINFAKTREITTALHLKVTKDLLKPSVTCFLPRDEGRQCGDPDFF